MRVRILEILLGDARAGLLFQYGEPGGTQPVITRFVADDAFARDANASTLSLAMKAADATEQAALWANVTAPAFNGTTARDGTPLLPPFFDGLLPEGVFLDHVAEVRGCDARDRFELLAACGEDLPGNVRAHPVEVDRETLTRLVTQQADALEPAVVADPLEDAVSLSGVQPKLGVLRVGDRFVGRTRLQDTRIIAKLPLATLPLLPELEELSLRLAHAAGVEVCEASLEPMAKLAAGHRYELGDIAPEANFLAATRFDRTAAHRVHVEDFSQVMGVPPGRKYSGSYLEIAAILMSQESLGESAVHELLRRLAVNEMLGNPDMHLKNIGLIYLDGRTPQLSPAYDVVAYAAMRAVATHALPIVPTEGPKPRIRAGEPAQLQGLFARLTPGTLRRVCGALGIPEKPAAAVIRRTVEAAVREWPAMIAASTLSASQKTRLLQHFEGQPLVTSLRRRGARPPAGSDLR